MTIRKTHKSKLQEILQEITYKTKSLSVSDHYQVTADKYPYVFITSHKLTPNKQGSIQDNATYLRVYEYMITLVFMAKEDNGATEDNLDELEELIINKLQSVKAFYGMATAETIGIWQALTVDDVSESYNPDPNLTDNCIYKTFSINIETEYQYA
jgi:hypothetical protein